MLDTIKSIVGNIAPVLGGMIGGPLGASALSTVSKILLGKDDGSADEIQQALLNATPKQLSELKKIEADLKIQMRKADIKEQEIYLKDVQSARTRESELVKFTGKNDIVLRTLALTVVFGFFLILAYVLIYGVNEHARDIAMIMIGVLGSKFSSIFDYFFGSSLGSKQKDLVGKG